MKDQVEDEVTSGYHYHVQFVNCEVVVGEVQVILIDSRTFNLCTVQFP